MQAFVWGEWKRTFLRVSLEPEPRTGQEFSQGVDTVTSWHSQSPICLPRESAAQAWAHANRNPFQGSTQLWHRNCQTCMCWPLPYPVILPFQKSPKPVLTPCWPSFNPQDTTQMDTNLILTLNCICADHADSVLIQMMLPVLLLSDPDPNQNRTCAGSEKGIGILKNE